MRRTRFQHYRNAACAAVWGLCMGLAGIAHGQTTIDAPANLAGTIVNSPFYLQAEAPTCNGATTTSFGYSVDSGSTSYVTAASLKTMVSAAAGAHTVHLKVYNGSGYECDSSLSITVGGGVTVSAPSLSATLPGSFNLVAANPTCGGETTTEMGYSVDSGSVTTSNVTSLNTLVASGLSSGAHILRVKGFAGSEYCETDIPFSVVGGIAANTGAGLYAGIETDGTYTGAYSSCGGASQSPYIGLWQTQPDCGTVGTKTGSTSYPVTTTVYGLNATSRQHSLTYDTKGGGVRWFNQLTDNTAVNPATNFLYDLYAYIAPGSNVGQIEMDLNHASPANELYLLGVQCDLVNGVWDVTVWDSSTSADKWLPTKTTCTSSQMTTGTWHHIQVKTHHDAYPGTTISYDEVSVDGSVQTLDCGSGNCTSESSLQAKSWAESLGPNFQLDGGASPASGTTANITAYVSSFNIWYW